MKIRLRPGNNSHRARAGGAAGAAKRNNFFCRIFGHKFIIKNLLHTAAIVFCLPIAGWTQTCFVKPGDTGSIELPIENDIDSVADLEGAGIIVEAPSDFAVEATSVQ